MVVTAVETGGRFSKETCDIIRDLAWARAESVPGFLRISAAKAFEVRWSKMLAMSVANAFAASLLSSKEALACEPAPYGGAPWLPDLLSETRFERAPEQASNRTQVG